MNFELFNTLIAYGDQFRLKISENPKVILQKLEQFNDKWSKYNPRKDINRWGLSVTNLDGKLGPGPDLDSLYEYNKENNTKHGELDFNIPTPVYNIVKNYCDPFKEWLFRSHILKLPPGGFFPNHIDNMGSNINSFRLLVPFQVCNPFDGGYFIYEKKEILNWKYGYLYFLNTCKTHTIFNSNSSSLDDSYPYDNRNHVVLILNIKLTKQSVSTVLNLVNP